MHACTHAHTYATGTLAGGASAPHAPAKADALTASWAAPDDHISFSTHLARDRKLPDRWKAKVRARAGCRTQLVQLAALAASTSATQAPSSAA